jgi:hypothetical protein
LRIPLTAPSGLYWPLVGMYDFVTLERLPLFSDAADELKYDYRLPPVKVLNPPTQAPAHRVNVQMGELGELLGYDLSPATGEVRADESLSVMLYYRAGVDLSINYTRFLHLYDATRGMAAQQDGFPQAGDNPTWVWLPGEVIADPIELLVPAGTAPGEYTLYTGFYNAADGGRVPLTQQGQPLLDNRAPLVSLTVIP